MAVRVNKYLSEAGFCSRREADRLVEQGRVTVNGRSVSMGTQVEAGDTVEVDGERLSNVKKRVYIAFNKPPGVTCTTDPGDRTNIVDYINYPERIFNIGRLDKPSEGLIFLTNDGDIVNKILRAGNNHEKEYVVSVDRAITPEFAARMSSGVKILGTVTRPCKFVRETPTRFRITLTQGLNRQIRRMCEALEYKVVTLKRVRVMNIVLTGIAPGKWRYFTDAEITELNRLVAASVGTEEASLPKPKQRPQPHSHASPRPKSRPQTGAQSGAKTSPATRTQANSKRTSAPHSTTKPKSHAPSARNTREDSRSARPQQRTKRGK